MKKISKDVNRLIMTFLLVLLSLVSWVVANWLIDNIKKDAAEELTVMGVKESLSEYPDFYAIKGGNPDPEIRKLDITESCPVDGCVNKNPATIELDGIKKSYIVTGEFSRAYLFIEALVDYTRPLTVWDDFYFSINGLGGHLISGDGSLPLPVSNSSRFLYDLGAISYYPSIKDKERRTNIKTNVNLFNQLKNGALLNIWASVSSNRPGRVMREVSIYYECLLDSTCSIAQAE